jgi:hypothetical protein
VRRRADGQAGRWRTTSLVLAASCTPAADGATGDQPFRDQWRRELSVPFPYDALANDPGVALIRIGEPYPELGILNRGDVHVRFDAPPGLLELDLRRFAFAGGEQEAEEHFARLGVVARDGAGHDCTVRWWDRCTLTLFHDGQSPPAWAGADMTLHLPADYRHHLEIEAHDVSDDTAYPDRADVCIEAFTGDATIRHDSGIASVALAPGTTPAPACSPADLAVCEAEQWADSCVCEFGLLSVENRAFQRSDITADVPEGLWARLSLTNVDTEGELCELDVDVPDVVPITSTQQHVEGEAARPPGAVDNATGYRVELRSALCADAASVAGPGSEAEVTRRGDLRACSGCLAGLRCGDAP